MTFTASEGDQNVKATPYNSSKQSNSLVSQNVRMGIQYRFQRGLPVVNCERFLGYDKRDGKLVINEKQAAMVRRIFRDFLDGFSADMIAGDLRRERVSSGTGCTEWPVSSVKYILLKLRTTDFIRSIR